MFKLGRGPVVTYDGKGDDGQCVVVVPQTGLGAVRQIDAGGDTESQGQDYDDFIDHVIALAEASDRLALPPRNDAP